LPWPSPVSAVASLSFARVRATSATGCFAPNPIGGSSSS
jgi:hypothetical protein